jgi:hypothetical protein
MGTFVEYIRTNQTSSGRAFTAEEKALVLSIANKMMNKGFNMVTNESRFFPKELKPMKDMAISKAKELKENAPATKAQPQAQQDPITLIGLQIAEAAAAGNMDKVMALTTALNALKTAQQTEPQAPVAEEPQEEEVYEENEVELDDELADIDC